MNLHKLIFINNACYKAGRTITPKGIMVHSTGANNPNLNRYIGPDDGLLGKNQYNNHWNQDRPDGRQVCVHGFIGKLADGSIATYQTLPWNHRGWHGGGSSNDTHISFEICEDGLTDASYFRAVYQEAVELCVYLCKLYGLTDKDIIGHYEGYQLGIASNHGDPRNWFPKHGKSMDTFRDEVKALLNTTASPDPAPNKEPLIHAGDIVKIIGSKYYGGKVIPDWVKKLTWYVHSIKGNRAVLNEDENHEYAIMSPVKATDLVLVTAVADSYTVHSVIEGDTLWAISNRYLGSGSRYQEIMTLNGLTSTVINIGQKLKIPIN